MGRGLFVEAMMIVLRPTCGCLRIDVDLLTCRIWEVDGEQDIAACRAVPACEGFRNSGRNGFFFCLAVPGSPGHSLAEDLRFQGGCPPHATWLR